MSQEPGVIEVFTDGSFKRVNGESKKRAGLGVWWGHRDARNLSERCPAGRQNSLRAELHALRRFLEQVITQRHLYGITKILVGIDCNEAIQPFTIHRRRLRKSGWRNKHNMPMAESDLVRYIDALLDEAERVADIRIVLEHTYGHIGTPGNEGADRLANRGAESSHVPAERPWSILETALRANKQKAEREAALSRQKRVSTVHGASRSLSKSTLYMNATPSSSNPTSTRDPRPFCRPPASRHCASSVPPSDEDMVVDISDDDDKDAELPMEISDDESSKEPPHSSQTLVPSQDSLCEKDMDKSQPRKGISMRSSASSSRLRDIQAGLSTLSIPSNSVIPVTLTRMEGITKGLAYRDAVPPPVVRRPVISISTLGDCSQLHSMKSSPPSSSLASSSTASPAPAPTPVSASVVEVDPIYTNEELAAFFEDDSDLETETDSAEHEATSPEPMSAPPALDMTSQISILEAATGVVFQSDVSTVKDLTQEELDAYWDDPSIPADVDEAATVSSGVQSSSAAPMKSGPLVLTEEDLLELLDCLDDDAMLIVD